ncbi:hypothetical protein Q3G72_032821 [Acer saccharum]|nr:hypothetical protein Q3G72_032821 [Acer saccharum]
MSMPLGGFFEPEQGEFLSVREGLLLAKRLDLKIDWVELDAVHVASAVNYVYVNDGLAGVVLDDIRALCREVGVSKCLSIPRQGNEMAHSLAARAFFFLEDRVWLNFFIHDFRAANATEKIGYVNQSLIPRWVVPPVGIFKINSDAALNSRDKSTEAMSIFRGLRLAVECGLILASLESDAFIGGKCN